MKCPICNEGMTRYKGAWFCMKNVNTEHSFAHKVVVLCDCGRRMLPIPTYSDENGMWYFWKCPHCHKRGYICVISANFL